MRNSLLDYDFTHSLDQTLEVTEDLVFPGRNITLEAGTVKILGHLLDTSSNIADGGDITIIAKHILIDDGAVLDARTLITGTGTTSGDITIIATERGLVTGLGFANVDLLDTDVTIGAATIRGGVVEITGIVDTSQYPDLTEFVQKTVSPLTGLPIVGQQTTMLPELIGPKVGKLAKILDKLAWGLAVTFTRARTHVRIGASSVAPTVIEADTVIIEATAKVKILAKASAVKEVGVAVGIGITEATVSIDNALITTTRDLSVLATGDHSLNVLERAFSKKRHVIVVAVTVLDSTVSAVVTPNARLTVGRDLFVQAQTVDRNSTLANAVGDPAAALSIAIAVAVENGETLAALDGTAVVGRHVNVTAKQGKLPFEKKRKIKVPVGGLPRPIPIGFPSYYTGVSASASIGTPTTGNLFDDLSKSLSHKKKTAQQAADDKAKSKGQKLKNWASSKLGTQQYGPQNKPKDSVKAPAFQGALAVAVSIDVNDVTARIGDGVLGDSAHAADVQAGGFVTVTARISNRPDVTSSASTEFNPEGATSGKFDELTVTGEVKFGVSIAVTVGDFHNHADAHIAGNAAVDAGGTVTVDAKALNAFDPSSTFGTNLAGTVPFLSSPQATYTTADGTQFVSGGQTVEVLDGYTAGGTAGLTYRLVGADGVVDLGIEDYSDTDRWTSVNLASEGRDTFIRLLTTYLDGNMGLDNNLVDIWSQASAVGQKKASIAGSVAVAFFEHRATATIETGARINQDAALRTGAQDVVVGAQSQNDTIDLGGNFQTIGIGTILGSTATQTWAPKDIGKRFKAFTFEGVGGKETAGAVGATVMVFFYTNTVSAQIEDGTFVFGDNLDVTAANGVLGVAFGGSGGSAKDFGFTGVGIFNSIDDHTTASIGGRAVVALGGDASISATDTTHLITVAGSLTRAEKVGIGASVAWNQVSRVTQAYVGNAAGDTVFAPGGSLQVGGTLAISATNAGFLGAFAVAGATASNDKLADQQTAAAAAVGFGHNAVADTTKAFIFHAKVTAVGSDHAHGHQRDDHRGARHRWRAGARQREQRRPRRRRRDQHRQQPHAGVRQGQQRHERRGPARRRLYRGRRHSHGDGLDAGLRPRRRHLDRLGPEYEQLDRDPQPVDRRLRRHQRGRRHRPLGAGVHRELARHGVRPDQPQRDRRRQVPRSGRRRLRVLRGGRLALRNRARRRSRRRVRVERRRDNGSGLRLGQPGSLARGWHRAPGAAVQRIAPLRRVRHRRRVRSLEAAGQLDRRPRDRRRHRDQQAQEHGRGFGGRVDGRGARRHHAHGDREGEHLGPGHRRRRVGRARHRRDRVDRRRRIGGGERDRRHGRELDLGERRREARLELRRLGQALRHGFRRRRRSGGDGRAGDRSQERRLRRQRRCGSRRVGGHERDRPSRRQVHESDDRQLGRHGPWRRQPDGAVGVEHLRPRRGRLRCGRGQHQRQRRHRRVRRRRRRHVEHGQADDRRHHHRQHDHRDDRRRNPACDRQHDDRRGCGRRGGGRRALLGERHGPVRLHRRRRRPEHDRGRCLGLHRRFHGHRRERRRARRGEEGRGLASSCIRSMPWRSRSPPPSRGPRRARPARWPARAWPR